MQHVAKTLDTTVFVGIYGSISIHPWLDPRTVRDQDMYSLFATRSVAMGWAWTGAEGPHPELWGINDGDQDWREDGTARRIGLVQVSAPLRESREPFTSVYVRRSLPIQPLLACVDAALARIGTVSMTAVALLLPVHAAGAADELWSTANWFGTADPAARTPVRVTLDTGEGEGLRPLADSLLALVQQRAGDHFTIESVSVDDSMAVQPQPPVADERWCGGDRAPITFEAVLPEWSMDAIAWLVTLFAEVCRVAWVETSVLVSVGRVAARHVDAR